MMLIFYFYLLFTEFLYFLLSPVLFIIFRKKPLRERLAIGYPKKKYDLLVHAASVGEVNGIKQLLLEMIREDANLSILITVNTLTGRQIASNIHPKIDAILSPLDILHLRIKQLRLSNPTIVLITETEIWPSLMVAFKLLNISVIFINARMSEKTFLEFKKFKSVLDWASTTVQTICSQTILDLERFSYIFSSKVILAGNLKYSVRQPDYENLQIRNNLGYDSCDKILVLGCSRPGEEKLIIDVYDLLAIKYPGLKLIIAPRHLNRIPEIITLLKDKKVSYYSSGLKSESICIIDAMGHLTEMYSICNVAIIGGSFFPFGGHNPLEAAYYGKPIIIGPYHNSCVDSVTKLLKEKAIIVSSPEKLYNDLLGLLESDEIMILTGKSARKVIDENRTSLETHLTAIREYLYK